MTSRIAPKFGQPKHFRPIAVMAPALDSSLPLPLPPHILWLNVQKNICSIAVIYLFRGEGGKSRNSSLDSVRGVANGELFTSNAGIFAA